MTQLWPRLSRVQAETSYEEIATMSVEKLRGLARSSDSRATYAATGGSRVTSDEISDLADTLRDIADHHGYPYPADDSGRIMFDRAAAEVVADRMFVTTVEAANRGVWNFLALSAMPDLTRWRWPGSSNAQRWVASDLTRHMFARLWWQALTFGVADGARVDYRLLRKLTESDLNQLTERRSVAGNPRLAQALARAVVDGSVSGNRRDLLRSVAPRLRRRLAFIDYSCLSDEQLDDAVREIIRLG